jgi:F0F1-type ATP synthase delta subunit
MGRLSKQRTALKKALTTVSRLSDGLDDVENELFFLSSQAENDDEFDRLDSATLSTNEAVEELDQVKKSLERSIGLIKGMREVEY